MKIPAIPDECVSLKNLKDLNGKNYENKAEGKNVISTLPIFRPWLEEKTFD
jgi:hypothetical protein